MRYLEALLITIVIYALLFLLYRMRFHDVKLRKLPQAQSEMVVKINIRQIPAPESLKLPPSPPVQRPKNVSAKKDPIKKAPIKKVEEKKSETKKSEIKKVVKKQSIKKQESKPIVKQSKVVQPSEMLYIPNPIIQKQGATDQSSLASALGTQPSTPVKQSVPKTPKIAKLYGKKFDSFTLRQQEFIVQNLDEIQRITQNTLTRRGYPAGALAAQTGQEGVNVVSFDLHPNGDISNLRLLREVGYRALDENTIETIKSAYKDYPYPQETTKIIFYVEYTIFGY